MAVGSNIIGRMLSKSSKHKDPRMARRKARSEEATQFAHMQRQGANESAWTVWRWLLNRKCLGAKFRREVPIDPYTADFCCVELKLIIEIDGDPHLTEEGRERDKYLMKLGYTRSCSVKSRLRGVACYGLLRSLPLHAGKLRGFFRSSFAPSYA